MSARYLTTTLPYVNADPHLGFALEIVQADVLARSWRLQGDDVFFTTGTDEHGQKIAEAAKKAGQEPQAYVDHYAAEFETLKDALNLSHDAFIRTTDQRHIEAAQEIWRRCLDAGDIYKKAYTGLYCVGCESFKTESDLVEGKCPLHPNQTPQEVSEENYFFRYSNYAPYLLDYLRREGSVVPAWRRDEAIAFVKQGLQDFSIKPHIHHLGIITRDGDTPREATLLA
jgi:methionyl-tRNA synthetase